MLDSGTMADKGSVKGIKMKNDILLSGFMLSVSFSVVADPLSTWNQTEPKQALMAWVDEVTTRGSDQFIPLEKRYVVFDNDGTLWPESPVPFQVQFILDEIKRQAPQHPEWTYSPLLTAAINDDYKTVAHYGDDGLNKLIAMTHSGITDTEYDQRVKSWLSKKKHPRFGCRYDHLAYQPMKQLLNYLQTNGFKTWIVSAGGIDFMRVMTKEMYGIPPEQVIGSFSISEYALTPDGDKIIKTMKGPFTDNAVNKPAAIHLFMGHRPVAAFGNSDDDLSMLRYSSANPDYHTFSMLIRHTDNVREYQYDGHTFLNGNMHQALSSAKEKGWTIVDIKRDWNTVFDPAACPAPGNAK